MNAASEMRLFTYMCLKWPSHLVIKSQGRVEPNVQRKLGPRSFPQKVGGADAQRKSMEMCAFNFQPPLKQKLCFFSKRNWRTWRSKSPTHPLRFFNTN